MPMDGSLALLREFQELWPDRPSLLTNPAVQEFVDFIIDLLFEDIAGKHDEGSEEAVLFCRNPGIGLALVQYDCVEN